jgi:hypothetical protein
MMFFAEYNALRCGKEKERKGIQQSAISSQPKLVYCKDRNNWKIIS